MPMRHLLVDGTLEVKGEKADSLRVSFQGDRLDDHIANIRVPGQEFISGHRAMIIL